MIEKLPIALAQLKVGNTSENKNTSKRNLNQIHLNEICQLIYSCIEQKKLLKKYNNIMNSMKL